MNDFDRFLELKLRQMLDPVVATPPPSRKGRPSWPQRPILAIVKAAVEVPADVLNVVEPGRAVVPLPAPTAL